MFGNTVLFGSELFPNLFGKKGTIQVIVLNIFNSNSDLNIFDNSSEYIRNNFYPNILEKKYE